ncbi:MAG: hypothetical protein V1494_01120 [Candidatus Diapherotrites archaeon]
MSLKRNRGITQADYLAAGFDETEPTEPTAAEKADGLQQAFDKAQAKWQDILIMVGNGNCLMQCNFTPTDLRAFIDDIKYMEKMGQDAIDGIKEMIQRIEKEEPNERK